MREVAKVRIQVREGGESIPLELGRNFTMLPALELWVRMPDWNTLNKDAPPASQTGGAQMVTPTELDPGNGTCATACQHDHFLLGAPVGPLLDYSPR